MKVEMERDPVLAHNEQMKALGTLSYAVGLAMWSIGVLSPAIQGQGLRETPAKLVATWLLLGVGFFVIQQAILWNLKRRKETSNAVV